MPDPFTNARPYFDVTFPSSGDGFSIAGTRNAFAGLGFMDFIPLQPRAHNPADLRIMVRGTDASSFFNQAYWGNADQRIPLLSGDSPAVVAPVSNPRIDIVYKTPSGDILTVTGTEAGVPTLPSLSPWFFIRSTQHRQQAIMPLEFQEAQHVVTITTRAFIPVASQDPGIYLET